MTGKSISFDDKKISNNNFCKNKKIFNIYDLDVNKTLVSKKESFGKKNSVKYFIGCNNDDIIRPLCIKLPQMNGYVKHFDSNKRMSFKFSDKKLLKKYTKIWERVRNLMNTKFDSETIYGDNKKYMKTKIKLNADTTSTPDYLFAIRGRRKRGPETLHIRD